MISPVSIRGHSLMVAANGLRHHVLRYGEPGARDLLIVPGITSPAAACDFLAYELAAAGFHVTVPDVRGRGESERAAPGQYTLTDYTADIVGLVSELGLADPVLIGHSMGARIAAAYAVDCTPRHGLAVIVDPPLSGPGRAPYPTPRESFLEQLHQAQAGTDADAVRRFYPGWPERELWLRAEILASCDETAVLETYEGFHTEDFIGLWKRLTAPALLVRGSESPVVPGPVAAELRELRGDIDVLTVPGAGHMVPWDNLDGFLGAVGPYLARELIVQ